MRKVIAALLSILLIGLAIMMCFYIVGGLSLIDKITGLLGENTVKATETPSEKNVVDVQVDDTVNCFGLEITISGYEFVRCDDNNKYCLVNATLYNPGKSTIYLSDSLNNLELAPQIIYDKEYKYSTSWANRSDYIAAHDDIKPLETIDGIWQFKVPNVIAESDDKSLYFTLQQDDLDNDTVYSWALRPADTDG